MAEKENFLKARLTKEQSDILDKIVYEIQEKTPEANVTTSSITRYALEKYISEYEAKKNGSKIFIEIDTNKASVHDVGRLFDCLNKVAQQALESGDTKVYSMLSDFETEALLTMIAKRRTEQ